MLKIIADDKIPFLKGALEPHADMVYRPGADIDADLVKNADAMIVRTRTKCDSDLLSGSSVKFIASATIGFDHIDADFCAANGIEWTNAPGCNSSSVAQYVCSVLTTLWSERGFDPAGKTLGVIGVGNVGTKVAAVGDILGMRILLNDPPRAEKEGDDAFTPLPALLAEADVVTLHVPLNLDGPHETHHLADQAFFEAMKSGAVLINSSRGEVVDGRDLLDALKSGKPAAAVLDVWENEPTIDRRLLDAVFVGTPHIAGYSLDGKANGTAMSVNAVAKRFNLPLVDWRPNKVTPPADPIIKAPADHSSLDALRAVVRRSYDVRGDDQRLRANPETFERQRGEYPLRREFPAYTVETNDDALANIIGKLGFRHDGDDSSCRNP